MGMFAVVAALCFILLAIVTRPGSPQQSATPLVPLLGLALIALLTAGGWLARGWRWAVGALAIALSSVGLLMTIHSAYQLNYRWGDVPREMMIYTQTSPDVQRVIDRLAAASIKRGGQLDMPIWYDNETVWSWYMRRFTGAKQQAPQLSAPPGKEVMAVLMMDDNYSDPQNRRYLEGFQIQRFPLRWWFPEDQTYRLPRDWRTAQVVDSSSLLMRLLRNPFDGRNDAQIWQYLMYRQLDAPLGSTDFVLAVRPELADEIGPGIGATK
jgi:hypothetical protein